MAEKFSMPQTQAGLVRYFEESKESLKISPKLIIGVSLALIVLEISLKFAAPV
ncbi:MAG: preprotein translocase subunit Sec61beta [Candidatus Aenigmarchaeota archaeon]|nr:preprotein translocase subunit Sec61beta [Candidatus Aenigmarchaeota archaeon]